MAKDFQKIICPHCKVEISLDEAITHQFEESVKKQITEEQYAKHVEFAKLEKEIRAKLSKEKDGEINALSEELKLKEKSLAEARQAELNLRREKTKFEDEKQAFELEKQRQLDQEREKIKTEALKAFEIEQLEKNKDKEQEIKL